MSTDKHSGTTNGDNRPDDPEYIVRVLGQGEGLPPLEAGEQNGQS